jgi:flagellar biogenesis protein FliO
MPRFPWMLTLAVAACLGSPLRAERRLAEEPARADVDDLRADRATVGARPKAFRRPPIVPGPKNPTDRVVRASGHEPLANRDGLRLSPPKDSSLPLPTRDAGDGSAKRSRLDSPLALLGGLGIVLGLFLLLAWLFRRGAARPASFVPGEVVEVLGRAQVIGRQQLHLLRCGNKVLLVYFTPTGAATLTEITDPAEVDRLCGLCYQSRPGSATSAFRSVFAQLGGERSPASRWTSGHRDRAELPALAADGNVVREGRRA